ncbi:MAG: metallophosphoesterase, partial [Candidatus Gastranaerophilales bacterium]|nr:metallophosphoesterase [Candidatus Gastranaerophilales bacterium]
DIINSFIGEMTKFVPDLQSLFTPGNHEFDGGLKLLKKLLSSLNAKILVTNLDTENSPLFKDITDNNHLVNQKIFTVEDNKNPAIKNKLLFLGISPVNMPAYQKSLDGIKFIDNIQKTQKNVEKEDYRKTLDDCKRRIKEFKDTYPNGVVVLMAHTGVGFADNLAKESSVDLVFDGHEHKDTIRVVNGTPIIPLSMNFKKIVNAKIHFDDNGKLGKGIEIKSFCPLDFKKQGPIHNLYNNLLGKDLDKKYSIKTPNPNINILDITDIRKGNNYLANFVTDSVLEELNKTNPDIDFFALNSSAIRHPLPVSKKPSVSNFEVMNVLAGICENDGKIMTTNINGQGLLYLILDNFIFNQDSPEKNPLIQYSGLKIDKTNLMKNLDKNKTEKELSKFVIDKKTNQPIDLNKNYKIANVEKYFNKSLNPNIKELKKSSEYLPYTVQDLFKQHFRNSNGTLTAQCDNRIY